MARYPNQKKRKSVWPKVFVVIIVLIALVVGLRFAIPKALDMKAYNEAEQAIKSNQPQVALRVIGRRGKASVSGKKTDLKWLQLELRAAVEYRDIIRLVGIYIHEPAVVEADEDASVLVARAMSMRTGSEKQFASLQQIWESKSTQPESWFCLRVDSLIQKGNRAGAMALLKSRSFPGKADVARLTRIAMIQMASTPWQSWQTVQQATQLDPRNPDVLTIRAQIFERLGKKRDARLAYVASVVADPKNPLMVDQLAEFYIRQGSFPLAVQTWRNGIQARPQDFLWVKLAFWSKVAVPAAKAPTTTIPEGEIDSFAKYLVALKPNIFWDNAAFGKLPEYSRYLEERQESAWLRLLEELNDGNYSETIELIKAWPFKTSTWQPETLNAIYSVLVARSTGKFGQPVATGRTLPTTHSFIAGINKLAGKMLTSASMDTQVLVKSDEVFALILAASGWSNAAFTLHRTDIYPVSYPSWAAYTMTHAIAQIKGDKAALLWAQKQPPTPELVQLIGELCLATGDVPAGIKILATNATKSDAIGYRAAWLLSLAQLEARQITAAEQTVLRNQQLLQSVAGKEILAKTALARNQIAQAEKIYTSIASDSIEAKVFLAKLAYDNKQYDRAEQITNQLILTLPDELQFRKNMQAIQEARRKR